MYSKIKFYCKNIDDIVINYFVESLFLGKFNETSNIEIIVGSHGRNNIVDNLNCFKEIFNEKNSELAVVFKSDNQVLDFDGQIDPVFLSYLSLFIKSNENSSVAFLFPPQVINDSKFSLGLQLAHFNFIFNFKNEFQLKAEYLDKKTGELRNIQLKLNQSQFFIPPIYVDNNKETISKYFDYSIKDNKIKRILNLYNIKIKNIISEKGISNLNDKIDNLSFIETTLFLLLINEKSYLPLKGKKKFVENRKTQNQYRFFHYIDYVKEISKGLKELALNIQQHSDPPMGVITARVFDKERILELKEFAIQSFINQNFGEEYLKDKLNSQTMNNSFFLDINVIDIGKKSVRDVYVYNLENRDIQFYDEKEIRYDSEIIKNNSKFRYEDFFLIGENYFKLKHQQNKLISRFGLHHFTSIIKNKLKGYIKAGSIEGVGFFNDVNGQLNMIPKDQLYFPERGTVYNCIIPLKIDFQKDEEEYKNRVNISNSHVPSSEESNIYLKLNKFEIYDEKEKKHDNKKNYLIHYNLDFSTFSFNEKKYEFIKESINKINCDLSLFNNDILLINVENSLNNEMDKSDWIRFLSALNSNFPNIILYNINKEKVVEIVNERRSLESLYKSSDNEGRDFWFWGLKNQVLFYSKQESKSNTTFRYGATLLAGHNANQFDYLNFLIWNHHFSFGHIDDNILKIPIEINERKEFINKNNLELVKEKYLEGNLFFTNNRLNYFELIIKNNNSNLTLLEHSIQYSLNKTFQIYPPSTDNNKGYKDEETHFRLGSKIHISDFYYAKRLFQNSFFTIPLAYTLAKKVESLDHDITIVGYESYSDALISNMRYFLEKKFYSKKINHFTINSDGLISRSIEDLKTKVIIVVPIVSTFSTSLKIKKDLERVMNKKDLNNNKSEKLQILHYFNVIVVGNKNVINNYGNDLGLFTSIVDFTDSKIESLYGWGRHNDDAKTIEIREIDNNNKNKGLNTTIQEYFIPVYTKWHDAKTCELCFPNELKKERTLTEVGKIGVTPKLIFAYPKSKKISDIHIDKIKLTDSIIYGNLYRDKNKYLYFFKMGDIINETNNKEVIKNWLLKTVKPLYKNNNDKIVLLTPVSSSKSNFVDLVNEYLFDFTANIIRVSIHEDYIENAELLYSDGFFDSENTSVIYVDDVIATLNAFLQINYIVKYIRKKIISNRGIDFCISLINRMSFDVEDNLLLNLKDKSDVNYCYLERLLPPTLEDFNNHFPLDEERNRYKLLANISCLDAVRNKFYEKRNKLKPININEELPNKKEFVYNENEQISIVNNGKLYVNEKRYGFTEVINGKIELRTLSNDEKKEFYKRNIKNYRDKKLFQLLVKNAIYSLFAYSENKYINDLNIYFNSNDILTLKTYIENFLTKNTKHKDIIEKYSVRLEIVIYKILCSAPLNRYKPIKDTAFKWLINELENRSLSILNKNQYEYLNFFKKTNTYTFSEYGTYMFLLKRSVDLNNNFIITSLFLSVAQKIINEIIPILNDEIEKLKKVRNEIISKNNSFDNTINYDTKITHYYQPNQKKFILDIITLVQELVLEHNTKSIQLEKVIDHEINKIPNYNNDIKNANYTHLLRLLKLENTEIAFRYWEDLKQEHLKNDKINEEPQPISDKNLKLQLGDDTNSLLVKEIFDKKPYNYFLEIKRLFYNRQLNNSQEISEFLTFNNSKFVGILPLISRIIGNELVEVMLSINYNIVNITKRISKNGIDDYKIKPEEDLYTFHYVKENNVQLLNDPNENSINYKIFNGLDIEGEPLSNFEIRKSDVKYFLREGIILDRNLNQFQEIKNLENQNQYNLLFIRISDFYKVNGDSNLITQAVVTFRLNNANRLSDKKLRLILLLRKSFSKFLNKELEGNVFLELLENRKQEEFRNNLNHRIKDYLHYLVEENSSSSEKHLVEVKSIISQLISSQISIVNDNGIPEILNGAYLYNYFAEYTETIFRKYLFGCSTRYDYPIIDNRIPQDLSFKLSLEIKTVVLIELIINQKKYGYNNRILLLYNNKNKTIILNFKNSKREVKLIEGLSIHKKGYGFKMIEQIIKRLKDVKLKTNNNKTNTTLIIKQDENNSSF